MEFFKKKTNINFLGIRKITWSISATLILISLLSLGFRGINWGIDFTGGYQVQVHFQKSPSIAQVKNDLANIGLKHADVVTFGSTSDLLVTFSPKELSGTEGSVDSLAIENIVMRALPGASIEQVSSIDSQVGSQLANNGLLAMVIAIIAIMAYITMRFEVKFALSAAISLAHDPIIILGIFSIFQLPFDLSVLAAVLAAIGYSLNDIVVVYDRIRESLRKMRSGSVVEVVNRAVNDTLSRTIMTSGLTFLVTFVLFIFGGPSLHYFALAFMIGVVIGTYSSIYNAGALAVLFGFNREAFNPKHKDIDGRP